jgi:hypothetical protein
MVTAAPRIKVPPCGLTSKFSGARLFASTGMTCYVASILGDSRLYCLFGSLSVSREFPSEVAILSAIRDGL